jgi:hypothetical protein
MFINCKVMRGLVDLEEPLWQGSQGSKNHWQGFQLPFQGVKNKAKRLKVLLKANP